jgi:hypothetical protein
VVVTRGVQARRGGVGEQVLLSRWLSRWCGVGLMLVLVLVLRRRIEGHVVWQMPRVLWLLLL